MNRKRIVPIAAVGLALSSLTGCIIVDGTSSSNYKGYGSVERAEMQSIVAANAQNRIGEDTATVLGRYPAEHVSLVHSHADEHGRENTVYRVYARERDRSTKFERFLVFRDGRLTMLTDDRDEVPALRDADD